MARHQNPGKTCVLGYLQGTQTDLIVLATHHRDGPGLWLRGSISEPVARKSGQMTLFVPAGTRRFYFAGGRNRLAAPHPCSSHVATASATGRGGGGQAGASIGLHRGYLHAVACRRGGRHARNRDTRHARLDWERVTAPGEVVDVTEATARRIEADLIVMSTEGHHGFLDALRGSHSERVLRAAPCPVLAIPPSSRVAEAMS